MSSNTLNDQFIADTFGQILHTGTTNISSGNIAQIYDGNANTTSLQIGLSGAGINVLGQLSAAGFKYPTYDPGPLCIPVSDGLKVLSLSSITDIFHALGMVTDGTYTNPTLVITNGVINNITANASGGLSAFSTAGGSTFTVPPNVYKVKFTVTGGGGGGGSRAGGAGGTVTGYLVVNPGQTYTVTVGAGGTDGNAGSQSSISNTGNTYVYANGGNTTAIEDGIPFGGGLAGITANATSLVLSYYAVQGGSGGIDTNDDREECLGAASIWGSGPAYGGGSAGNAGTSRGILAGSGFVLMEW